MDGVISITLENLLNLEQIRVKPTRITGADSIRLGSVRIRENNGSLTLLLFSLVVAVTDSEFPFDHDVNTSVGLAVGTYFFCNRAEKNWRVL